MQTFESFAGELYPSNDALFAEIALKIFRFQATNNPVYKNYLTYLGVGVDQIETISKIPFLPISFFKSQNVITGFWEPEVVFTSSGAETSRHCIPSLASYLDHTKEIFERNYGSLDQFHVLCLLPSYLERTGSSLVAMASHFIKSSKSPFSGFYLSNLDELVGHLEELRRDSRKVLLLGVSFALLDLAERYEIDLSHCIVMETGGMKGRRKEMVREELHEVLLSNLNIKAVHSEYGMTELLSQAYSQDQGKFGVTSSLRVIIKETNDPFSDETNAVGIINAIDLGNVHSCAFIETQDLGRKHQDGHFEVLGRLDNSDIRGCNLMVQ